MIDAMKQRLVQSNAERVRRIESGEITVVGVNAFTETADSPLVDDARRRAQHPRGRRRGRARAARAPRAVARRARRRRGRARARRRCATPRAAPTTSRRRRSRCAAPAGPSASGPARCARCSASTARRPASVACTRRSGEAMVRCASTVQAAAAAARPPDPHPGRQARARRPLERRRADRGRGTRRGHGGRLPGHPPHARADRGRGARRGRRPRRPLGALRLAPQARARDGRDCCARTASTPRSSSAASSPKPTAPRCSRPASRASTRPRTSG